MPLMHGLGHWRPQLYAVHPFRLFTAARANASGVDLSPALKAATGGQPGFGQDGGWAQDLMNDALLGRSLDASALVINRQHLALVIRAA